MNEKEIKECFINTMNNIGISDSFYSLEGYKEGASCIVKENGKWIVFDAERAERYGMREYKNMQQACLDVIKRFTYSKEDYIFLSRNFKNNLSKIVKRKPITDITYHTGILTPRRKVRVMVGNKRRIAYKALADKATMKAGRRRLPIEKANAKRRNYAARKNKRSDWKTQDILK